MTDRELRFRLWAVARLGCKNGFSLWGTHKFFDENGRFDVWRFCRQQFLLHPLAFVGVALVPAVLLPPWGFVWASFWFAIMHENTQFFSRASGTRNINGVERLADVGGFLLGGVGVALLWWGLR